MLLEWADVFLLQNVGDGVNGVMMDTTKTVLTTKALAVLKIHPVFVKALIILLGRMRTNGSSRRLMIVWKNHI